MFTLRVSGRVETARLHGGDLWQWDATTVVLRSIRLNNGVLEVR